MKKALALVATILFACACHKVKQKADEALNKAGETIGRSTTQFIKGVGKGIEETGDAADFSAIPKESGLETGKIIISSDSAGRANVISVYFIFGKDFNSTIQATVADKNGLEYGRTNGLVTGKKGSAGYTDFHFDARTSFEDHSKFVFQPASK